MLDSNLRKLSSNSAKEWQEISETHENPPQINQNLEKNSNYPPRFPTMESFGISQSDSYTPDQKLQDSLAQYLILNSQQRNQPQNPLNNFISPEAKLVVETHILQDLFLSSFKRLLQTAKPTIISNLSKSIGITHSFTPSVPNSLLRESPDSKRKNTDPISFDTYESDKNQHLLNPQTPNFHQLSQRHQMNLSSFNLSEIKGNMATLKPQEQKDYDSWDSKEEKKQ